MNDLIDIRKARDQDRDAIWEIIREVISSGDTYVFDPGAGREQMMAYWCGQDKHTYVALMGGEIEGTFFIRDNFPDLGSHVANASFMTRPNASGKGIGTSMGEFALKEARDRGYLAMQFNIVVKTNVGAIHLWKKLGFEIKGEIPDAFRHRDLGLTDAYIMWRKL